MNKNNNRQAKIVNIFNEALNKQNSGKYDEAIKIYKGLLKKFPGNFFYEININLGKSFFEIGNYLIAAEIFHKLHETQPENIELFNIYISESGFYTTRGNESDKLHIDSRSKDVVIFSPPHCKYKVSFLFHFIYR